MMKLVTSKSMYMGYKLDWNKSKKRLKFTQPVLLQIFVDEFDLPKGKSPVT